MGPLLSIAAALALVAFLAYAGVKGLGHDSRDGYDWNTPGPTQNPAQSLHPRAVERRSDLRANRGGPERWDGGGHGTTTLPPRTAARGR